MKVTPSGSDDHGCMAAVHGHTVPYSKTEMLAGFQPLFAIPLDLWGPAGTGKSKDTSCPGCRSRTRNLFGRNELLYPVELIPVVSSFPGNHSSEDHDGNHPIHLST